MIQHKSSPTKNERKKFKLPFCTLILVLRRKKMIFFVHSLCYPHQCNIHKVCLYVYIYIFHLAIGILFVLSQFLSFIHRSVCVIMRFLFFCFHLFRRIFHIPELYTNTRTLSLRRQQFAVVTYRKKSEILNERKKQRTQKKDPLHEET